MAGLPVCQLLLASGNSSRLVHLLQERPHEFPGALRRELQAGPAAPCVAAFAGTSKY